MAVETEGQRKARLDLEKWLLRAKLAILSKPRLLAMFADDYTPPERMR